MNTCLVTKLKSVVDNQDLKKLDEIKIVFNKIANPTIGTNSFLLKTAFNETTLRIVNGFFTDSTLTTNLGTTLTLAPFSPSTQIYVSNTGATVFINNKFDGINGLDFQTNNEWYRDNVEFDIEQMSYSKRLQSLRLTGTHAYGDIGKFKANNEFAYFIATNCQNIYGSVDEFFNNAEHYVDITSHGKCTLDIDNIKKTNIVTGIYLHNSSKVQGNIEHLADVAHIEPTMFPTHLVLYTDNGDGVTGNIESLVNYFGVNGNTPGEDLLLTLNIPKMKNVSGSINTLASGIYTKGKVGGKLSLYVSTDSNITVNGEHVTKQNYVVKFTQSGYTIE